MVTYRTALPSTVGTVTIDCVDSSTTDNGFCQAQRRFHPQAVLTNSVRSLVSGVINRAGYKKISRLRIFGHGNKGLQAVGGGQRPDFATQVIYVDNGGNLIPRGLLALLCGRFAPNALVQLHGCDVAAGGWSKGLRLLQRLCDLWDVRVQAALVDQYADAGDRFEGTYYIEADGSYNKNPVLVYRHT